MVDEQFFTMFFFVAAASAVFPLPFNGVHACSCFSVLQSDCLSVARAKGTNSCERKRQDVTRHKKNLRRKLVCV